MERSIDESHDDYHPLFGSGDSATGATSSEPPAPPRRSDRHRGKSGGRGRGGSPGRGRRHHRRRFTLLVAIVLAVAVVAASWVIVRKVSDSFAVADYSGAGSGSVTVTVLPGDAASDIANTLAKAGVVKSAKAFVNAANRSGKAGSIQPGSYTLPLHASGDAAMSAILDPANLKMATVTIPEGFTYKQVLARIAEKTGLRPADLAKAAGQVADLGIPEGLKATSVEGMLFPATYRFGLDVTAVSALQAMVAKFGDEYATLQIAAKAKALKLSPYEVLIIASIAEAEAKFPADLPKVARVIMNRLEKGMRLQVDATSTYAAKLDGKDLAKVLFQTYPSVFNTYTHDGLPPTPIGNPGTAAISAALAPTAGNWLFYVNSDAAGHLSFFTDQSEFEVAAARCKAEGWGCGG